jgi:DNA-binding transcriptional ArsR family regulator
MANETIKKAKAATKKGTAGAGKVASRSKAETKGDMERSSESVELVFGINAGIVWESLNLEGSMTAGDLVKATSLLPEDVYGALGWLGREGKISVEKEGKTRIYSLKP